MHEVFLFPLDLFLSKIIFTNCVFVFIIFLFYDQSHKEKHVQTLLLYEIICTENERTLCIFGRFLIGFKHFQKFKEGKKVLLKESKKQHLKGERQLVFKHPQPRGMSINLCLSCRATLTDYKLN